LALLLICLGVPDAKIFLETDRGGRSEFVWAKKNTVLCWFESLFPVSLGSMFLYQSFSPHRAWGSAQVSLSFWRFTPALLRVGENTRIDPAQRAPSLSPRLKRAISEIICMRDRQSLPKAEVRKIGLSTAKMFFREDPPKGLDWIHRLRPRRVANCEMAVTEDLVEAGMTSSSRAPLS